MGAGAGAPVEMKAGDAVVKVEKPEVCGLHVAPLFVFVVHGNSGELVRSMSRREVASAPLLEKLSHVLTLCQHRSSRSHFRSIQLPHR